MRPFKLVKMLNADEYCVRKKAVQSRDVALGPVVERWRWATWSMVCEPLRGTDSSRTDIIDLPDHKLMVQCPGS
ncbi:MAG: hypothetical protein M3346_06150 [Actinomycetota bacterium]|nr:hypothetical protein [Actinomycetota bacterium]